MALLNEINVKGVPHPIVTDDGYYQEMTVGDAEQLVATTFTEDDAPYNFRTAGGAIDIGDRKQVEGLVGGTVAWNQLVLNPLLDGNVGVASGTTSYSSTNKTRTITSNGNGNCWATVPSGGSYPASHVYLLMIDEMLDANNTQDFSNMYLHVSWQNGSKAISLAPKGAWKTCAAVVKPNTEVTNLNVYPFATLPTPADQICYLRNASFFDLTQMFGSTIADYIYALETANAGAGVAWFKKLFPKPYYAYNAGELMSVKALRHITRGFNAWDGVQEQGIYDVSTGLPVANTSNYRNKNFVPVLPNTKYCYSNENAAAGIRLCYYDADKNFITSRSNGNNNPQTFITPENAHYVTFYWSDISKVCLNLSWDGERDGEYEEYAEHIYELDPDLELRGIPKLSAGNDLYYDGDIYEPDGTVTRKYGIIDLGTIEWNLHQSIANTFYGDVSDKAMNGNVITSAYPHAGTFNDYNLLADKTIYSSVYLGRFAMKDTTYATAEALKAALSGKYAVYELDTPTTETADPYNGTQIVDDFGTEEFVDAGVAASTPTRDVSIPVGHNSLYQPNLRAKLEMVPEAPEDNGYYVVYHHDGINEYVPLIIPQELPNLPSEDGTYTLKCTVASGSATLSFESEV